MKKNIKTRIAPSPTGMFHIGTARTALFNYLFAKKNKGKFILRIEDTDQKRSEKKFEDDITNSLKWLGLNWDGEIFYQSKRSEIYQKYINILLKKKLAYKKDGAIWFDIESEKFPEKIIYQDLIKGKIEFEKKQFNNFVLIKKDGIPLYMFAAVVDDYLMDITHVIRGEDHITNTPQQILIYQAFGWKLPEFGHIPLILNTDRTKMSKRKDPVSVSRDFKNNGYLPEALINFMVFLGWNPKSNEEIFSLDDLIKIFDITKVNKSSAVFDLNKLNYFNNYYLKKLSNEVILKIIIKNNNSKYLEEIKKDEKKTLRIIEILKDRLSSTFEFDTASNYFFETLKYDKKMLIFKKSDCEKTLKGLKISFDKLNKASMEIWHDVTKINDLLLEIIKNNNFSNGDVFWPIRVALSGSEKSVSPTELLWVLQKNESLKRLKEAIKLFK